MELDAIHSMMANGDPEEEIAVMTRSSIVATEEVKIWRTAQEEDPVVQDIIQRVRQRQVRSAFALTPQGLLVQEDDGQRKLVVPTSMRQKVMASCHDEPTKGHTGIYRTMEQVKQRYWWKDMGKDIENYVKSCPVCQVMKSDHRKKVGPLQPIPIPTRKWEQITTDLVTDLPSSAGYTTIAVFVDRLTKMVHFAPCTKEISADQYAQLFVDNVFRLHGTPEVIILDRVLRSGRSHYGDAPHRLGTPTRSPNRSGSKTKIYYIKQENRQICTPVYPTPRVQDNQPKKCDIYNK